MDHSIYFLISDNSRIACTDEIEKPNVEVTLPPLGF